MTPYISIIVPVFNTVDFLERCVKSLCSQTWSNIEILLIDDGSKDGSGAVCDKMASLDDRITVIHQDNGGLSAARNVGINLARGEYLAFVDSDDWIHPRFIETLYECSTAHSCKMSICGMQKTTGTPTISFVNNVVDVLPRDQAIPRMLRGEWVSAWGKLYHRSLFDNIRFPEGRNNEDYAILIYLFELCDAICYVPDILYYYFIREGSITRSPLNDHSFDELFNGHEIWEHCSNKHPEWENLALFNLTASIIKLSGWCVTTNLYPEKYTQMRSFLLANKKRIFHNPELAFKYKPFLWALLAGKSIHRTLMLLYYKKH